MKLFLKIVLTITFLTNPVFAETFMDALKRAYDTNPELNAEREIINISEQELKISKGSYLPTITLSGSKSEEDTNKINEGGRSQKLILFNLGKDMSQAPIKIGTNQLPNPPIAVGITKKKIIKNACDVTKTLYN